MDWGFSTACQMQNKSEANRRFLSDHQQPESGTFSWSLSPPQTLRSAAWSWSFPSILATRIFKKWDCILHLHEYTYVHLYIYIYIHNHIIMSMINYMHTMRPILTTVLDSKTSDASNLRHARLSDKTRPNTTWLVPMRRRCPLWPPPFERCNGRVCGMQLILPWHELQKHEETRRVPAHPNGRRLQMGMQVASLLHLRLMEKAAEPFTI